MMATRFDYLEARETMAERRGHRAGLKAAVKELEAMAVKRFLNRENVEATKVRDLAFIVEQMTVPPDEKPYRHLIDDAIAVLGADDSEVLEVHSYCDVDKSTAASIPGDPPESS
jgi:DnaJ-domain-containing protein 1